MSYKDNNTMKKCEELKDILVQLAIEDKLPLDMTQLDSSVFEPIIEPMVHALTTLHNDAVMALNYEWDRGDGGFECQLEVIERIIDYELNEEEDDD
jgi:hypothetical protein